MRMIKNRALVTVILLSFVAVSCSLPFSLSNFFGGQASSGGGSEEYQADVDSLRSMTRGMDIPAQLLEASQPRPADAFDPNQLLIPLDHLTLEPGYTLDYFYHVDGLGAYPLLYARREEDAPFTSEAAYEVACYPADGSKPCKPYRHLMTDGTEDGYFQLALMLLMGDQFYLDWHANYNDGEVIASSNRLETLIEQISAGNFGYAFSNKQNKEARKLNLTPEIVIGEEETTVSVVLFTKWGGFYRYVVAFSTSTPYEMLGFTSELLVEYDCGVMF